MVEFDPKQLEEWTGGRWEKRPNLSVRGFAFDSRRIQAGDLFVCIRTERRDGHGFLKQAAAAGAVAAMVDRARPEVDLPQLVVSDPLLALGAMASQHRRRFTGPVVAVTGSCGKTSTKNLLALLLAGAGAVHATEGNFNNLLGVPLTLLGIDPARHRAVVVEAGINQPGEMAVLARMIRPDHAVVTLIAPAHLEELGDLEGVAAEKAILAQAVPHSGAVVFPGSCLLFEPFHDLAASVITTGLEGSGENSEVTYRLEQKPDCTVIQIKDLSGWQVFTLRKVSPGMAANAVLAVEMARMLDVGDSEIQERLMQWTPANHRGEVVEHGANRFYIDCYNANPAAMEDSLEFFNHLAEEAERRIYVMGCMGELGTETLTYHRDLGRRIRVRPGDRIFITGNTEVWALKEGLLAGGTLPEQIQVFSDVAEIEDEIFATHSFVFVKGSRVYALEKLVERAAQRWKRIMEC
jgi:UDP-N-acetylmuramoyl-tripeptide--D-alanyl-D-alanine ligase